MRSPALSAALRAAGIDPCGDSSCIFGAPGGMATNGGCSCARVESRHGASILIQRMAMVIRALDAQVAR